MICCKMVMPGKQKINRLERYGNMEFESSLTVAQNLAEYPSTNNLLQDQI